MYDFCTSKKKMTAVENKEIEEIMEELEDRNVAAVVSCYIECFPKRLSALASTALLRFCSTAFLETVVKRR